MVEVVLKIPRNGGKAKHIHRHKHTQIQTDTHTNIYIYVYMYIYIYVHTDTDTDTYTNTITYTDTDRQTHTPQSSIKTNNARFLGDFFCNSFCIFFFFFLRFEYAHILCSYYIIICSIWIYVYIYIYMCVYIYIYICIYIYIYEQHCYHLLVSVSFIQTLYAPSSSSSLRCWLFFTQQSEINPLPFLFWDCPNDFVQFETHFPRCFLFFRLSVLFLFCLFLGEWGALRRGAFP